MAKMELGNGERNGDRVPVESSSIGSIECVRSLQDVSLKIIMVGDSFVGKSSLIDRYVRVPDCSDYDIINSTIGVDFAKKDITVDDYRVQLLIWDTAGQERYRSLIRPYFRKADGVVAVYDVTNRETFESIEYWVNIVNAENPKPVVIIVGNKIDKEGRQVTRSEGLQYSKDKGALFMETSILITQGIGHIFEKLTRKVLQTGVQSRPLGHVIRDNNNYFVERITNCFGL